VQALVKELGEHFDAVVILCTRHDGEGTRTIAKGCGNWHAQYGLVNEWLVNRDEETKIDVRVAEEARREDDQ
jgi:hypothetical protein